MQNADYLLNSPNFERNLLRLYWVMRLGIAFIWIWTAIVSWFAYPHEESIDWLRRVGLTYQTSFWFAAACLMDLAMGVASCWFASRRIWQFQFALIVFYSLAISIGLPEFLAHPFGPITKNIAILACLAYLIMTQPMFAIKKT